MTNFSYISKRSVRAIRNLIVDPFPRNKTLAIKQVEITKNGFDILYIVESKRLKVEVSLPADLSVKLHDIDPRAVSPTLAAIALAFSPFFFKLTDFHKVLIEAYALDDTSKMFFAKFLQGGLGEFRYLQGLNPSRPIVVDSLKHADPEPKSMTVDEHVLMLNGGGKDTIVAGELLTRAGQQFTWVTIRPNQARRAVVELSGNESSVDIGYKLDEGIESFKVYPWGHFPHTSIVLSLGLLVAQLLGVKYVCVGNEYSANYGNLTYRGFEVNHQYTKSTDYERGFANYVSRCVTPDIEVFSILRPFHDLQLAKLFSRFTRYHTSFISCNRGITRNEWCKACSKCAFTALALYPFVGRDGLVTIFGEDIFLRRNIRRHVLDLVGDGVKPWECVGTTDENKLALKLLLERNPGLSFEEEPTRSTFENAVANVQVPTLTKQILESTEPEHRIPEIIKVKLNRALLSIDEPQII